MASLPSTGDFEPQKGSFREPTQKTETYIAGDGGGRVYVPTSKSRFEIHWNLGQDEVNTLIALYAANAVIPVDFFWVEDGLTYSVYFDGRPVLKPDENWRWDVTAKLVEA